MDELLEQFLIEGRDLIAQAADDCTALVSDGSARQAIDSAFRAVHTLKGSAAIVSLLPMESMLHAAEDLLGAARSSSQPISAAAARALLSCIDQCDRWIDALASQGRIADDADGIAAGISAQLRALAGDSPAEPGRVPTRYDAWAKALVEAEGEAIAAAGARGQRLSAIRYLPREDCFFAGDDPLALIGSVPGLIAVRVAAREDWPLLDQFDPYRCMLAIDALSTAELADVRSVFRLIPDQVEVVATGPALATPEPAVIPQAAADPTIRVEAEQVDRLLDLMGELLIARNEFGTVAEKSVRTGGEASLRASGATMDRVLRDMHRAVMAMRMVPVDRVLRRIARMVRDTAPKLGREVEVKLQGMETKVDKAIADALFDPLLHLARNALDHGIEVPDRRLAAGKPARGEITLSAHSSGGQVVVTLADDGQGIDPAVMRELAVKRGLHSADGAAALTDEAAMQLVFAPGFSSAAEITDLSGRGVGMDAVKAAVERLGGRVVLDSSPGKGTRVSAHLPATAALTSVLTVTVAGQQFAVPMDSVVQTARISPGAVRPVGTGEAFVIRDRTVPLLDLARLLGLGGERPAGDLRVLVIEGPEGLVGFAVDDFSSRSEVILRPMTGLLSAVPVVAGTTLTGDGSILFILNLGEVVA
ncbi:chemotaxis protein CheA [Sphingomonas sp. LHG3406-1]|uniref:chemotaxis protein CheA n=1 Tax=Sphingomonas sp. LHG3406-1 TaxID=2804617 RepID=UPI00261F594D|nr:chemotaxis protein CheA [Sphingomonas sp. LHG3406-1]